MHELIPDSALVMFPDGGHLLPVEEAGGICRELTSWLARKLG
jgi:pimeloyl-ACP methyl ester carboxylesterase